MEYLGIISVLMKNELVTFAPARTYSSQKNTLARESLRPECTVSRSLTSLERSIPWHEKMPLEKGVDIRYIQELLGFENSKTTEIYTHITKKGMRNIKSPLDGLDI